MCPLHYPRITLTKMCKSDLQTIWGPHGYAIKNRQIYDSAEGTHKQTDGWTDTTTYTISLLCGR